MAGRGSSRTNSDFGGGHGRAWQDNSCKKVYDNKRVVEHFDCHAWITVSQSFKMEEVLRNMIKKVYQSRNESIPEGTDAMDEMSLITRLREYLEDKRYVVFDDVWKLEFWRFIKYVLPENKGGSRIIITTRNVEVGSAAKESSIHYVHNLQALPPESSWELFCKKAFQGCCCPPELEEISLDIVKDVKDCRLQLWQWAVLYQPKRRMKDHYVNYGRLIRLWIAEGFVKGKKRITLEQVAKEYLTELIHRSLVQLSDGDYLGKIRSCRVHDLMREIILRKAEELSFCRALGEE
ncbi:Disease resistance protein RPM1, partial [Vitis vinifera]